MADTVIERNPSPGVMGVDGIGAVAVASPIKIEIVGTGVEVAFGSCVGIRTMVADGGMVGVIVGVLVTVGVKVTVAVGVGARVSVERNGSEGRAGIGMPAQAWRKSASAIKG